jgi:hypothetical protein
MFTIKFKNVYFIKVVDIFGKTHHEAVLAIEQHVSKTGSSKNIHEIEYFMLITHFHFVCVKFTSNTAQ